MSESAIKARQQEQLDGELHDLLAKCIVHGQLECASDVTAWYWLETYKKHDYRMLAVAKGVAVKDISPAAAPPAPPEVDEPAGDVPDDDPDEGEEAEGEAKEEEGKATGGEQAKVHPRRVRVLRDAEAAG